MDKINHWQEELHLLQSIITQTELIETIKWGSPVYIINDLHVLGVGGFKKYFYDLFF